MIDTARPKIRVYLPGAQAPTVYMPACCHDPSPEMERRVFSGDTTHQNLYCASCDTTWFEFRWKTRDVEELFEEQ